MGKYRMHAFAMLAGLTPSPADYGSNDNWDLQFAARHVPTTRDHVGDLIHGQEHKIHSDMDVNGSHTVYGGTQPEAGHAVLGQGGDETSVGAEFFYQSGSAAEYALMIADIKTIYKYVRIPRHFDNHGFVNGFSIGGRSHMQTSVNNSFGDGKGAEAATETLASMVLRISHSMISIPFEVRPFCRR